MKITRKFAIITMVAVALVACLGLTACGGSGDSGNKVPDNSVMFVNNSGTTIENLHINTSDNDQWGDPVASGVANGKNVILSFDALGGQAGDMYDCGTIDSDYINIDVYGVTLLSGDTIDLQTDGKLVVTGADGVSTEYVGQVYSSAPAN